MRRNRWEVPPEDLRVHFDLQDVPFATTAELPDLDEVIAQDRAMQAIAFGLQMRGPGYNLYVSGPPATGRRSIVKRIIQRLAEAQPTPDDWCYVYNFEAPHAPRALRLPAGTARELQRDIADLLRSLETNLIVLFRSAEYQTQRRALEERFAKSSVSLLRKLKRQAKASGFEVTTSRRGLAVKSLPGKPSRTPGESSGTDRHAQTHCSRRPTALDAALSAFQQQVRALDAQAKHTLEEFNRQMMLGATEPGFAYLRQKYLDLPQVLEYLQAVQQDVLVRADDFVNQQDAQGHLTTRGPASARRVLSRYAVSVLVDNAQTRGAPLVEESHPTCVNLFGCVLRQARYATSYADFTMFKAGSLLRANGGYLLLHAPQLLREPCAWEALKRALARQEVVLEDGAETQDVITPSGLTPEPIPMQTKVIMLGTPMLFAQLQAEDEEFRKLFKVQVEFDEQMDRGAESVMQYGRFIARLCRAEGLRHLERDAVVAVLEQACRWVEHQRKLSLQLGHVADLVREASYWADQEGAAYVARSHIQQAVAQRISRANLVMEHLQELIAEGTLTIDVRGAVVGQINALSLSTDGDFTFGLPSRITARVFLGETGIVNIEREIELSEEAHSKGVLILSGYLGGRYASEIPLSFSATLCFEQTYDEVAGDSASAAELAVLLSALSDMPLDQGVAVTGSIDQGGRLQAVSGVNEKIESFYAVCQTLGLTGTQGVIIPHQNLKHLMLHEDVVQAVAAGRFHIYAVSHIDEVLEILMKQSPGGQQLDGQYSAGSLDAAVLNRLHEMHNRLQALDSEHLHRRGRRRPRS